MTRIPQRLFPLGLVFVLAVSTGHATMTVALKTISVGRTLGGHVYVGKTNEPADDVTVDLCTSDWNTVLASTKTDEKGYFLLEKPTNEKLFHIRVSAPGMDIYELRVRIKKHAAQELTIHLTVAT